MDVWGTGSGADGRSVMVGRNGRLWCVVVQGDLMGRWLCAVCWLGGGEEEVLGLVVDMGRTKTVGNGMGKKGMSLVMGLNAEDA